MEKEFLTIKQAAEMLNVTNRTIYNYINNRQLKAQKRIGARRLYVAKTELLKMVDVW